jgi:hypothetical protein
MVGNMKFRLLLMGVENEEESCPLLIAFIDNIYLVCLSEI